MTFVVNAPLNPNNQSRELGTERLKPLTAGILNQALITRYAIFQKAVVTSSPFDNGKLQRNRALLNAMHCVTRSLCGRLAVRVFGGPANVTPRVAGPTVIRAHQSSGGSVSL